MKVKVLGTGAAFSLKNGNVSYLLEEDGIIYFSITYSDYVFYYRAVAL